ncbi:rubredoxin-like domain-containing protein [Desulfobacula sp.]
MKTWQCTICKYIHKGEFPPEKCPVCGADASKFIEIKAVIIPEKKALEEKATATINPKREEPEKKEAGKQDPVIKKTGIEKINALLIKHHAHPVLVHTPNGILPAAVILLFLSWISGYDLLSKAAFINLIFVIIALPLVIFTGIIEWKKKYNGALTLIFKIKILAASLTTISCVISLVWLLIDPEILSSPKAWVFMLINIIMIIAAGIAGHIGGKLVFKD